MSAAEDTAPFHFGRWVGHHLLFSDVVESDQRTPCVTFTVPDAILRFFGVEEGGNEFGILAPQLQFWLALGTTLALGALFSSCMSCIIYKFIILPTKQTEKGKGKQGGKSTDITPFLVGFGIVMPLCVIYPFYANSYFIVRSKILRFLMAVAQIVTFFRCSEAMFGFLPKEVDLSTFGVKRHRVRCVVSQINFSAPMTFAL